jgi:hypothetical protein
LREGLEECFTINRWGIPSSLHRCLATTNLIESPQSGVRMRTRQVCRWRDAAMVERWAAASFLATEKNFRRIMGWKDLWQLEAIWEENEAKMLRPCRRSRKMLARTAPSASNYERDTVSESLPASYLWQEERGGTRLLPQGFRSPRCTRRPR